MRPADRSPTASRPVLLAGDAGVYLLATLIGFATHRELSLAAGWRMLATWLPFSVSWLVLALGFGLYRGEIARSSGIWWRAALVAACSAPLGAWLRSLLLGAPVVPVFVLVMVGVTATGMLAWRTVFAWQARRRSPPAGV